MTRTKHTDKPPSGQPPNGYSRIPDDLWPKLIRLSSFEAKLFLLLNSKANRVREPVGLVDANVNAIALVWMHTSPGSVRRGLRRLAALDLIDWCPRPVTGGSIRVRHLVDHGDPLDHEDPHMDHGDPKVDHGDPPNRRKAKSRKVVVRPRNVGTYRNENIISVRRDGVTLRDQGKKVTWNREGNFLETLNEDWEREFEARWSHQLGGRERYRLELSRAEEWLKRIDAATGKRRWESRADSLEGWLEDWMGRSWKPKRS